LEEVEMETSDNSDTDEALERPSPDEAAAAEDSQTCKGGRIIVKRTVELVLWQPNEALFYNARATQTAQTHQTSHNNQPRFMARRQLSSHNIREKRNTHNTDCCNHHGRFFFSNASIDNERRREIDDGGEARGAWHPVRTFDGREVNSSDTSSAHTCFQR
jgi:hypothetical protein